MAEILFCSDVIHKHMVEEDYHAELKAVDELNIPYSLFDLDEFEEGTSLVSIKNIKRSDEIRQVIYRGWMLNARSYAALYNLLLSKKNVALINTPEEYRFCHHLPDCYKVIEGKTPKSVWISRLPISKIALIIDDVLKPFGKKPIILKDYVKSAKHYWDTACFIPDASDINKVIATIEEFHKIRDGITGGLVFREYIELEQIGTHPISKIPISKEYRLFFLNGEIIDISPYWEEGEYDLELPPVHEAEAIAKKVKSKFFSMDVAKTCSGYWVIIELGDGQVSGLPVGCDIKKFYAKLKEE